MSLTTNAIHDDNFDDKFDDKFDDNFDDNFDGDFDIAEYIAEFTCKIFEVFDNMGRDGNNIRVKDDLVRSPLCDDFEPMDDYLCPYGESVDTICRASKPLENPAVKNNWCIPIFGGIKDAERRDDCIKFCINYVSDARGGCCNIGIACDL